ncbi:hypothetical protein [Niveibacterium sp.]|uniref:hypothetical protein n=1 Tax=Niveibacterium sp. TaxID=2017444 RepID=UPI0035B28EF5
MQEAPQAFISALLAASDQFEADGFRVASYVCDFIESLRARPIDEVSSKTYFYAVALERLGLPPGERWCPGPTRHRCSPALRSPYLDFLETNDRVGDIAPPGHPVRHVVLDASWAKYALLKYLDLDAWMAHVRGVRGLLREELRMHAARFPEIQIAERRPTVRSLTDLLMSAAIASGFDALRNRSKPTKSLLFSRSLAGRGRLLLLADGFADVISGGGWNIRIAVCNGDADPEPELLDTLHWWLLRECIPDFGWSGKIDGDWGVLPMGVLANFRFGELLANQLVGFAGRSEAQQSSK